MMKNVPRVELAPVRPVRWIVPPYVFSPRFASMSKHFLATYRGLKKFNRLLIV